jgi:hypothetical protein
VREWYRVLVSRTEPDGWLLWLMPVGVVWTGYAACESVCTLLTGGGRGGLGWSCVLTGCMSSSSSSAVCPGEVSFYRLFNLRWLRAFGCHRIFAVRLTVDQTSMLQSISGVTFSGSPRTDNPATSTNLPPKQAPKYPLLNPQTHPLIYPI